MALAFICGQFLFGTVHEFREWYELLPLGWMLVSEAVAKHYECFQTSHALPISAQKYSPTDSVLDNRKIHVVKGCYWLTMSVLLVLAFGIFILAEFTPPKPKPEIVFNQPHLQKPQLQIAPHSKEAMLNNLAWTFAISPDADFRSGAFAVKLAKRACELTHYRDADIISTLAAAYAEAGRFDDAISTGQKACALASKLGELELLKVNQALVVLYQTHQPYHEAPSNSDGSLPH